MGTFLFIALAVLPGLGTIGYVAERQPDAANKNTGLTLLPGDIKYESPNGNFKFYVPITTSIVVSLVLSLLLRFFGEGLRILARRCGLSNQTPWPSLRSFHPPIEYRGSRASRDHPESASPSRAAPC